MARYLSRAACLGGVLAVGVMVFAAGPSGAAGVKPTAVTKPATKVNGHGATLNGNAGAGVSGGDPTTYYFQYGKSKSYGHQTHHHKLGACPAGISPPSPYCTTPASQPVSARVSHLKTCTRYHFRIVATNPNGTTDGADMTFRTKVGTPIKRIKTPTSHVTGGHHFDLKITLADPATVTIAVLRNGHVIKIYHEGHHHAGTFTARLLAPRRPGKYALRIKAKESCGSETIG